MGIKQRRIKWLFSVTMKLKVSSGNAAEEVQPEGAQRQSHTHLGCWRAKRALWKKAQVEMGIEEWIVFSWADMGVDTGRGISGRGQAQAKTWKWRVSPRAGTGTAISPIGELIWFQNELASRNSPLAPQAFSLKLIFDMSCAGGGVFKFQSFSLRGDSSHSLRSRVDN